MVTLPREPNRRELRAFWTLVALAAGTAAGWLAPVGTGGSALVGAGVVVLVGLPGWLRPHRAEAVYGAWNRMADLAGRAAARWISLVTFYVLVTVVSRAGSRMPWEGAGPDGSGWLARPERDPHHAAQHHRAGRPTAGSSWIRSLAVWARDTGNVWAVTLVPLLALLRLLRPRAGRSLGENIYTLY